MTRSAIARLAAVLGLMGVATAAGATHPANFEPRAMAMGGSGVAGGSSANATLLNPALLAVRTGRDRFNLTLPIGARLSDPGDLIDAVDDFTEVEPIGAFRDAIAGYDASPGSAAAVEASGNELIAHFDALSDRTLRAEGLAALVLGVPGERFGVSVFASGYVLGGATGTFSDEDRAAIQDTIAAAGAGDPTLVSPVDGFTSSVEARFATVAEAGVSLATRIEALGGISVGVTPKYVQVTTYDYAFRGGELDDAEIDLDQGERKDSDINLDVGVAAGWGDVWMAGISVRDVVSREYRTVRGNVVKIEPRARIGIARRGERLTVAADLDLTERAPMGLQGKRRDAIIGIELDLFRTMQLRAGYRHNMSDVPAGEENGVFSAGLGFSPFGMRIDLAVMGNSDEVGAAGQIGVSF